MAATRPGGHFTRPVELAGTPGEIEYEVYVAWKLVTICPDHDTAVQALREALSTEPSSRIRESPGAGAEPAPGKTETWNGGSDPNVHLSPGPVS